LSRLRRTLQDEQQESRYEGEADSYKRWVKVLAVVIVAGVVVGYGVSSSYAQHPYYVGVNGDFTSHNGGVALYMAVEACNAWLYQNCPDPGEYPVYQCWAPPVMNMSSYCVTYDTETSLGHYEEDFRNGENYAVTGYLIFKNGTFDKVCQDTVVLTPAISQHNATENLTC
jgi:hypothetical protein